MDGLRGGVELDGDALLGRSVRRAYDDVVRTRRNVERQNCVHLEWPRAGHLRRSSWAKGEWTDDLLYALLREEWPPATR